MSDKKISQLTASTLPLAGTEVLPVVQSGTTKQVSVANLTAGRQVDASYLNVGSLSSNTVVAKLTSATQSGRGLVIETYALFGGDDTGVAYKAPSPLGYAEHSFWVTNNKAFTVNPDGNAVVNYGNLIQGTAAKGINFTANTPAAGMTSQLLNWYEEGTFTPTIIGTVTAGTGTYSTQSGTYTRSGRVVTFSLLLAWTAHTGTGDIRVNGLPFTPSPAQYIVSPIAYNLALTAGNVLIARTVASTASIELLQSPTGGGAWSLVPMDTNVDALLISGSYTV